VDLRFAAHRFFARVTGFAGLFALGLAVMGVYGAVSFGVTQRFREMAIRQAMGAGRRQVVADLVSGVARVTLVGMLLGLAVAVPAAYLARGELFGVSPLDPVAVVGTLLVIGLAALGASLAPARRLLRSVPMDVLREE